MYCWETTQEMVQLLCEKCYKYYLNTHKQLKKGKNERLQDTKESTYLWGEKGYFAYSGSLLQMTFMICRPTNEKNEVWCGP